MNGYYSVRTLIKEAIDGAIYDNEYQKGYNDTMEWLNGVWKNKSLNYALRCEEKLVAKLDIKNELTATEQGARQACWDFFNENYHQYTK